MDEYVIIFSTFAEKKSAKITARELVEKKIAACVQLLPIESIYFWEGAVEESAEVLLLIKTAKKFKDKVYSFIKNNHSYAVPELLAVDIASVDEKYLIWMDGIMDVK